MTFRKMDSEKKKTLSLGAVCSVDTRWSSGYTDQQMSCLLDTWGLSFALKGFYSKEMYL